MGKLKYSEDLANYIEHRKQYRENESCEDGRQEKEANEKSAKGHLNKSLESATVAAIKYPCDICNTFTHSKADFEVHLNGSKHRKKIEKIGGDYTKVSVKQKTATKPNVLRILGLDCEMVGIGPNGNKSSFARVSIVNESGDVVYDKYVKQTKEVTDYRTDI